MFSVLKSVVLLISIGLLGGCLGQDSGKSVIPDEAHSNSQNMNGSQRLAIGTPAEIQLQGGEKIWVTLKDGGSTSIRPLTDQTGFRITLEAGRTSIRIEGVGNYKIARMGNKEKPIQGNAVEWVFSEDKMGDSQAFGVRGIQVRTGEPTTEIIRDIILIGIGSVTSLVTPTQPVGTRFREDSTGTITEVLTEEVSQSLLGNVGRDFLDRRVNEETARSNREVINRERVAWDREDEGTSGEQEIVVPEKKVTVRNEDGTSRDEQTTIREEKVTARQKKPTVVAIAPKPDLGEDPNRDVGRAEITHYKLDIDCIGSDTKSVSVTATYQQNKQEKLIDCKAGAKMLLPNEDGKDRTYTITVSKPAWSVRLEGETDEQFFRRGPRVVNVPFSRQSPKQNVTIQISQPPEVRIAGRHIVLQNRWLASQTEKESVYYVSTKSRRNFIVRFPGSINSLSVTIRDLRSEYRNLKLLPVQYDFEPHTQRGLQISNPEGPNLTDRQVRVNCSQNKHESYVISTDCQIISGSEIEFYRVIFKVQNGPDRNELVQGGIQFNLETKTNGVPPQGENLSGVATVFVPNGQPNSQRPEYLALVDSPQTPRVRVADIGGNDENTHHLGDLYLLSQADYELMDVKIEKGDCNYVISFKDNQSSYDPTLLRKISMGKDYLSRPSTPLFPGSQSVSLFVKLDGVAACTNKLPKIAAIYKRREAVSDDRTIRVNFKIHKNPSRQIMNSFRPMLLLRTSEPLFQNPMFGNKGKFVAEEYDGYPIPLNYRAKDYTFDTKTFEFRNNPVKVNLRMLQRGYFDRNYFNPPWSPSLRGGKLSRLNFKISVSDDKTFKTYTINGMESLDLTLTSQVYAIDIQVIPNCEPKSFWTYLPTKLNDLKVNGKIASANHDILGISIRKIGFNTVKKESVYPEAVRDQKVLNVDLVKISACLPLDRTQNVSISFRTQEFRSPQFTKPVREKQDHPDFRWYYFGDSRDYRFTLPRDLVQNATYDKAILFAAPFNLFVQVDPVAKKAISVIDSKGREHIAKDSYQYAWSLNSEKLGRFLLISNLLPMGELSDFSASASTRRKEFTERAGESYDWIFVPFEDLNLPEGWFYHRRSKGYVYNSDKAKIYYDEDGWFVKWRDGERKRFERIVRRRNEGIVIEIEGVSWTYNNLADYHKVELKKAWRGADEIIRNKGAKIIKEFPERRVNGNRVFYWNSREDRPTYKLP